MTTQDIKPWYKQSPLWPIPNNWDVFKLNQIWKIITWSTPSRKNKNYRWWENLWANSSDFTWRYIIDTKEKISEEWKNISRVLPKGSILVTCIASIWLNAIAWKELSTNQQINGIIPNNMNYSERIYYYIEYSKTKLEKLAGKTAVPIISKWVFEKIEIPLPPLPEQEAIANILWKVDENIEKTQNMIEKLELRNKWLEQKLLTWKTRLKWFNWEFKKLSADKIFKSVSIKNLPNEELLSATQEQWIIPRSMLEWRVTMPTSEAKSYKLVVPWNFVISLRSFQWGLEYSKYRWIVSPAYTVLDHILPICDDYYKYYFKSYDFIWHLSIAVVWIRDWKQISFDDFCTLNLPYPEIEEQKAIANILNKANEQLNKYEQKLEKLQELKKWLMQQLLTWKVRVKEFRN